MLSTQGRRVHGRETVRGLPDNVSFDKAVVIELSLANQAIKVVINVHP